MNTNGEVNGIWIDPEVDFPNVPYISDYAALAINSYVYVFGGIYSLYDRSDRVVLFHNNNYKDIGIMIERRYGHEVIQTGHSVFIIGGYGLVMLSG